jgi:hypothetical protein
MGKACAQLPNNSKSDLHGSVKRPNRGKVLHAANGPEAVTAALLDGRAIDRLIKSHNFVGTP